MKSSNQKKERQVGRRERKGGFEIRKQECGQRPHLSIVYTHVCYKNCKIVYDVSYTIFLNTRPANYTTRRTRTTTTASSCQKKVGRP